MKRIFSLLLTFAIILSMSIPAMASEIEAVPYAEEMAGDVFFYDAETGEITGENGEPYSFEEIEFEIPVYNSSSEDGIAPAGDLFELYIVRGGLKKTSGGLFTWWFNVDCPTSPLDKPNIKLTAQLRGNFTNGSTFSNVGSSVYHTYKTNSEYGVDYTWTSTAKTGYYCFKYTLTDYDAGGVTQTKTTSSNLWNRTGHVWNYSFSDTGKTLPKPRADWTKGAIHQRPNGLADTYYTTYTQMTGKTLDRSLYDIHHIQPLSYGGDNSYNNLIHLPKSLHSQVTGWFNGY